MYGQVLLWLVISVALIVAIFMALRWLLNRGPHQIACDHFHEHVYDSDVGVLVRDIQRDASVPHGKIEKGDPLAEALAALVRTDGVNFASQAELATDPARAPGNKVLMLSGGGQWGAYGAGLFRTLSERSGDDLAMTDVRIITGISTGSLQLLLLMVALDGAQTREMRRFAIERLVWGYSPGKEREVVANSGMTMLPLRGSQAGTKPLRKRIREAIMPAGDTRLVEAIGQSSIAGFIGFVEAQCGLFHYADVRGLVKGAPDLESAAEALILASMASSAMPVFHQQMRVRGGEHGTRSLYDGGVRRSVFFESAIEHMTRSANSMVAVQGTSKAARSPIEAITEVTPDFFVVRNGPTARQVDEALDRNDGPILNGKRAYDLLVNESEIGAIAQLRLLNPHGRIFVTTADQWDSFPCRAGDQSKKNAMFQPGFMTCLRDLGRHKAARDGGPWWPLSPLRVG